MFNCAICNKPSKLRESPVKFVVETRNVEYVNRQVDFETGLVREVITGRGTEIVKEISVHEVCAAIEEICKTGTIPV